MHKFLTNAMVLFRLRHQYPQQLQLGKADIFVKFEVSITKNKIILQTLVLVTFYKVLHDINMAHFACPKEWCVSHSIHGINNSPILFAKTEGMRQ